MPTITNGVDVAALVSVLCGQIEAHMAKPDFDRVSPFREFNRCRDNRLLAQLHG